MVQRKGPVYCLVPCRVPSWLIGVHPTSVCLCVLECVCVCVSWLLSPVRLPTLDWTPVALAVKGHSTWVDILSPTSATNLPEPSHSKAPLWSSTVTASYNTHALTQLVHLYTLAQMSTQTQRTPVLHSCALLHFLNSFKFTFFSAVFSISLSIQRQLDLNTTSSSFLLNRKSELRSSPTAADIFLSESTVHGGEVQGWLLGHYTL